MELGMTTSSVHADKSKDALLKENEQLRCEVQKLERQVLQLTSEIEELSNENNALKEKLNIEVKSYQIAEQAKERQARQQKREGQKV